MSIPVLPPSAPFSPQQRAFLNGFFAGVFGMDSSADYNADSHAPSNGAAALALNGAHSNGVTSALPEAADTPWHDPNLPLDERMQMAQGKPKPLLLMAAMAQLDCGQCGYLCKTYSAAIAEGTEKSLKKCIPGGKETATKLKELMAAS